jgi:hypothetical protein
MPIYQQSVAASRFPGNDIAVAIADHIAIFQIDVPMRRGIEKHAGLGFAAIAPLILAVRAYPDVIHGNARPQLRVHGLYNSAPHQSIPDIWLVGNNDHEETSLFERFHRLRGPGQ